MNWCIIIHEGQPILRWGNLNGSPLEYINVFRCLHVITTPNQSNSSIKADTATIHNRSSNTTATDSAPSSQTQTDQSLERPNWTSSKNRHARLKKSGIRASKPNCSLHHLSLAKRVVGASRSFLAAERPKTCLHVEFFLRFWRRLAWL